MVRDRLVAEVSFFWEGFKRSAGVRCGAHHASRWKMMGPHPSCATPSWTASPERKGCGAHHPSNRNCSRRTRLARINKMVPSDPSKQLVPRPACTARTWHPQWRGTKPLLPVTDSSSVTDQRSSKRRPSIPVETDFSIRPFTRQRRGSPCGSPVAGLTLLAYIFEIIPEVRPRPFGFSLPASSGLLWPFRGTINAMEPVAKRSFQDSSFVFKLPLPSRTIDPSGS